MPVALITGASRGLGLALARALVGQGWELVIDARGSDALRSVAEELGPSVRAVQGDVTDPAHRKRLFEEVGHHRTLDLLVNNASVLGPTPLPALDSYPLEDLEVVFSANAFAPLALIQFMLPQLRKAKGVVINVSSDAAVEGYEGWGGYGSSKAALDQLTRVLAAEEPKLSVYSFDPGDMRTVMQQEAFPDEDISDRPEPETVVPALLRLVAERPPSGRYRAAELGSIKEPA